MLISGKQALDQGNGIGKVIHGIGKNSNIVVGEPGGRICKVQDRRATKGDTAVGG